MNDERRVAILKVLVETMPLPYDTLEELAETLEKAVCAHERIVESRKGSPYENVPSWIRVIDLLGDFR